MPATCIDNIISIKDPCSANTDTSLSGWDLFDLPGISYQRAASAADEDYISGYALLKDKRRLALMKIKSDLIGYLQGNGYMPNIVNSNVWRTGVAQSGSIKAAGDGTKYRGNVLYARRNDCVLSKTFISKVYIKPDFSGDTTLYIHDGSLIYNYSVTLVAGKINAVTINFAAENSEVQVMLSNDIAVYPVKPKCSCGDDKSDCVTTLGINDGVTTKEESYGIWCDVACKCDYAYLLCFLATESMMGEIAMYLTGALVMDEVIKTDRLNYYTIYAKEEAQGIYNEWMKEYAEKWNTLIAALPKMLRRIDKCGCIDCAGGRFSANI